MFIEKELSYKRHWINIDSDIISEQSYLYTKYDIDQETIEYALDKNERAHMDYNRENGTITFIYNVLALEKDNEYYETIPLTFIVQDTRLVTISNKDNAYVISKMQDYVDMISNAYYPVIECLDQQKDEVSRRLRQTTTSKNLYDLSDLEIGMVYLVAAATQNRLLLEHIKGHAIYRRLNEVEKEQFDDAMIEARQLVAMTDLISKVLQHLSGSYDNILNNNLNNNLSNLSIIEVLLGVIAVITGFFGMNVPLPFMTVSPAWIFIIIGSAILCLVLARYLRWLVHK